MMRIVKLGVVFLGLFFSSSSNAQEQPFRFEPVGEPYLVPVQPYAPYQQYRIVPNTQPVPQYYAPCAPMVRCRGPRGVWGFGPFVMGYYW